MTVDIEDLSDLGGACHGHDLLVRQAFALSSRVSVYDAVYVSLAMLLDARLVTTDRRLAREARTLAAVDVPG